MTSSYVRQQIAWFEQIVRDKERELDVERQRHHRKSITYQQLIAHKNDRIQYLETLDAQKEQQLQSLERETAVIKQRLREIEQEADDSDSTNDAADLQLELEQPTASRFVPETRRPRQATFEQEVRPVARAAASSPPRAASREMRDSLGKLEFEKRAVSDELLRLRDELQSTRVEMEQQLAVLARIEEASAANRVHLDDDDDDGIHVADVDSFCSSGSSDIEMLVARVDGDAESSILQMLAVELNNKGGFFVTPRAPRTVPVANGTTGSLPLDGDWFAGGHGAIESTTPITRAPGGCFSPSRYTPLYLYSPPHNGDDSNEADDEDDEDDAGCLEDSAGSCEWIWSDEVPAAAAVPATRSIPNQQEVEVIDLQPQEEQAQLHDQPQVQSQAQAYQQPLELFDQVASQYHHTEFSNHFEEILLDNSSSNHQPHQQYQQYPFEDLEPSTRPLEFASPSPIVSRHCQQYAHDPNMKWIPTPTFERLHHAAGNSTPAPPSCVDGTSLSSPFTFKQPSPIPDMCVTSIDPSRGDQEADLEEYALELDAQSTSPFLHQSSRVELAVCSRLLAKLEQNNTELIMVQTHADIVEHQHEQLVLQLAENERLIQHYKLMAKVPTSSNITLVLAFVLVLDRELDLDHSSLVIDDLSIHSLDQSGIRTKVGRV
mgnify:FL=1